MNELIVSIVMSIVIIVPHGDDEVTLLPLIQASEDVTVVIMTDGAASSKCPPTNCEEKRRESTESFLAEAAPHARLVWIGRPDGGLSKFDVSFIAANLCDAAVCDLWAAGADYGHSDHDAVRDGVAHLAGQLYVGDLRQVPSERDLVERHYGWLGPWTDRWPQLGLLGEETP